MFRTWVLFFIVVMVKTTREVANPVISASRRRLMREPVIILCLYGVYINGVPHDRRLLQYGVGLLWHGILQATVS